MNQPIQPTNREKKEKEEERQGIPQDEKKNKMFEKFEPKKAQMEPTSTPNGAKIQKKSLKVASRAQVSP